MNPVRPFIFWAAKYWLGKAGRRYASSVRPQRCDGTQGADFRHVKRGKARGWIDTRRCWLGGLLTRETSVSLRAERGWENSSFPFLLFQEKSSRACVSLETQKLVLQDETSPNYYCLRKDDRLLISFLVMKAHLKLPVS
jgi:hypothetical protein